MLRLRPIHLTGEVTFAGAAPDRPDRGLIIERRGDVVQHHRVGSPAEAIQIAGVHSSMEHLRRVAVEQGFSPLDVAGEARYGNGATPEDPFGPEAVR